MYYIAQRVLTNEKAIKVVTGMESFSFVLCEYNDYALCESTSINSYKNNKLYPSASKTILYAFGYNNNGQLVSLMYFIIDICTGNKQKRLFYACTNTS